MLTKAEALDLVESKLKSEIESSYDVVIVDSMTVERDFGWVFFYNSREFLETGDSRKALYGNLPILVNRHTGIHRYICFHSTLEESIAEYEAELYGHKLPTRYQKLLESYRVKATEAKSPLAFYVQARADGVSKFNSFALLQDFFGFNLSQCYSVDAEASGEREK
jgi:hypothetical protein